MLQFAPRPEVFAKSFQPFSNKASTRYSAFYQKSILRSKKLFINCSNLFSLFPVGLNFYDVIAWRLDYGNWLDQ